MPKLCVHPEVGDTPLAIQTNLVHLMPMRLSSLADYAVVMMSAAARHCGQAQLNAAHLAEETGIPLPTVQKLVSKLSHAGLLRSVRGAGGGFRLARPAAAVTLADVIEAIEGPIAMTSCAYKSGRRKPAQCRQAGGTESNWNQSRSAFGIGPERWYCLSRPT